MYTLQSASELTQLINDQPETPIDFFDFPSGFKELYRFIHCTKKPQLIVVGGRPGMGANIFCFNFGLHNALEQTGKTIIASQDLAPTQLWRRLISRSYSALTSHSAASLDVQLIDTAALTPNKLRQMLQEHYTDENTVVVLDSLQAMRGDASFTDRSHELACISRELAAITRELEVTIVVNTDLDRTLEKRNNKQPRLKDFSVAGNIHMDADVVMTLYRDELYHPASTEKNRTRISLTKNRYGGTTSMFDYTATDYQFRPMNSLD